MMIDRDEILEARAKVSWESNQSKFVTDYGPSQAWIDGYVQAYRDALKDIRDLQLYAPIHPVR